jgi:hypothetical protein
MKTAQATFENFSPMTSRIDNTQGLRIEGLPIAGSSHFGCIGRH